ncbi:Bax inhibitor-1/YccA family protein [Streptomyces fimicarius]|uniref:Bax inhibitor-1/YccA family protein n=2 Tax=Streptomyces TaxID=1883 RepID=A0AB33KL75_9ACTN|nr:MULTISPECIES: Bax inhibitor-1/YccA family protein [Streptomyces]MCL6292038.1 Bax inhibitor-1/YccA family protein [Streptomyces sp. 43Y-GA-1]MCX4709306.1 Bax inhibitor-1/YccA family protein [Streptomyces griseus]MDX2672201.1 Bax inhibitor-1/YccA family protein [Streptomyces sp. NRRL_ISP-5395]MDX3339922.1 Bax inhibitor-1/YccA family protein [Streptomyces sp. ME02-6979.5a]MDX3503643.1 Bax inhibitor-1/YccA family protein [Streptomyces sp. ATCC51928]
MRSSNPVFSRRGFSRDNGHAGFNAPPQAGATATGTNPYAQGTAANPYATNPYAQTDTHGAPQAPARSDAMTIDGVVTRTAMTLGTVILAAAAAWWIMPVDQANLGTAYGVAIGAAIIGFVLSLVNSFKRRPSPALILTYAAFEGVFLGIVSNIVSMYVAPGAAMQAVIGTMAVFAGVLIAYRTGLIRVTRRFYGFVMAAAIGFMLLMMVNMLFAVFGGGDGLGFRSGALGVVFGIVAIVIGACILALNFKQVEDGIAYGAPREEEWLAAFGLTVTLVWIYIEMLRLVAILSGDD